MNRKILHIFRFKAKNTLIMAFNNHVKYKFIHKKIKIASYDIICMSYTTKFTLTKQIYLSFDPMYLKNSINF